MMKCFFHIFLLLHLPIATKAPMINIPHSSRGDRPWKTMYARNRGKFRLNDRRRDSCAKHQSSEYLGWLTLVDALEAAKT